MKNFFLSGIFLIMCGMPVVSQGQNLRTGEKYDGAGRRLFNKAEPLTSLKRPGPFARLSDGSLFSAPGGAKCGISKDGGKTWTEYPLFDSGKFSLGSPVALQTRKGTIIIGFSNGREISSLRWNNTTHCYDPNAKLPTYIVCSKDGGKTWLQPVKLHDEWTGMIRGIIQTKDGHIVLSTMTMFNNPGRHCVMTYVSTDEGATWTPSNILDSPSSAGHHGGMMEADIIQLKDGRLWMLIRTNWDYFYESFSSDNGYTWSAYSKTNIDASSSPGALLRMQSGRIVLVWNRLYHSGEGEVIRQGGDSNLSEVAASWQRDELALMYSDDEGKTWSKPLVVADNITPVTDSWDSKNWLSYPHACEPTKGMIWITSGFGDIRIAVSEKDLPDAAQIPPGHISGAVVENVPGGANITYTLPDDDNLLYVKAVYQKSDGTRVEHKRSTHHSKIAVEGLGRTQKQTVQLICGDRSGNESAPYPVEIEPLDAPVYDIPATIDMKEDRGGIRITWDNPLEARIILTLYAKDERNNFVEVKNVASAAAKGSYNLRGFPAKETTFAVLVRDPWGNKTDDMITGTFTPLFEEQLDRTKFSRWNPPGLPYRELPGWSLENIWNGVLDDPGWSSAQSHTLPLSITFNTGQMALLNRIKVYQRTSANQLFSGYNVKKFQLWASPTPDVNADFDAWIFLGEYESVKPSGLPLGQKTAEDVAYATDGEEYVIKENSDVPVQYIRVHILETWGGDTSVAQFYEIDFFGQIIR